MKAINEQHGTDWTMFHGDCVDVVRQLPENSIDFGIHSPPFANLFIYSDSEADMGNCASTEEFIRHYEFLIAELFRVTVVGRLCSVHCKDLPKYANRDETTGLFDFPGDIIRAFEKFGWSFHSRVTVWKCPVIERERTNNNGLLHKTIKRDSSQVRQGMADYLITFRKPPAGTLMSDKPIVRPNGITNYVGTEDPRLEDQPSHPSRFSRTPSRDPALAIWQRYAEPVWWDIDQMDVLNFKHARTDRDERHICPLQIGLIERAIELWSNPGDVVLSPFAGIGSEGVGALRRQRKFVGVELKESYFTAACRFLSGVETKKKTNERTLFAPDKLEDVLI
jgi:DNA modification methylase